MVVTLLRFGLPVFVFLVLEWLWCWRPARIRRARARRRERVPPPSQGGWLTAAFVERRLGALSAELARLDVDAGVWAKAFRIRVARSAYESLLADARTLTAPGATDVEIIAAVTPLREVLEF